MFALILAYDMTHRYIAMIRFVGHHCMTMTFDLYVACNSNPLWILLYCQFSSCLDQIVHSIWWLWEILTLPNNQTEKNNLDIIQVLKNKDWNLRWEKSQHNFISLQNLKSEILYYRSSRSFKAKCQREGLSQYQMNPERLKLNYGGIGWCMYNQQKEHRLP